MQTRANSHGYTIISNLDTVHQARLNALEAFNGRGFYRMPWETTNAQSGVTGMSVGTDALGHSLISINQIKGQATMIFIAHQLPKALQVDGLIQLGVQAAEPLPRGERQGGLG
jgi:hypothetical protein